MTPYYLTQFPPIHLEEGDHEDQSHHFHPFTLPTDHHTSPVPCTTILFNTSGQVQPTNGHTGYQEGQNQQQELNGHLLINGSTNDEMINTNNIVDHRSFHDHGDQHGSGKWMSSKMRFMRKMMNSPDGIPMRKPRRSTQLLVQDQQQPKQYSSSSSSNSNNNSNGILRVCSDCNTTKTPLWRSGPSGPKSLCNACGIRQRKARRVMAAAAVAGGLMADVTPSKVRKEIGSDRADRTVPFKKRCRITATAGRGTTQENNLCFNDIVISLSKSSAFHRVFPQDEKDAAILLMALSCGLICSS